MRKLISSWSWFWDLNLRATMVVEMNQTSQAKKIAIDKRPRQRRGRWGGLSRPVKNGSYFGQQQGGRIYFSDQ